MEGNGDSAPAEHHDNASTAQSDDLKIQDEDEPSQNSFLRQSGGDTASPRSASAREKRDGSAGGLRGGGRRLFDIIQQVQHPNRPNVDEDGNSGNNRWRSIRDRFRRAGAAMTAVASGQTHPVSDPELVSIKKNPFLTRTITRTPSVRNANPNPYPISDPELVSSRGCSTRNRISVSVRNSEPSGSFPSVCIPPPEEKPVGGGHQRSGSGGRGGGHQRSGSGGRGGHERSGSGGHNTDFFPPAEQEQVAPAMSLMALLEQADSWDGSEKDEEEEDEEGEGGEDGAADEDAEGGGDGDGMLYECCVCMVPHKGAAFIPCGHTFCRLCSRELRVSRGSCPLCTGYILEILDIF